MIVWSVTHVSPSPAHVVKEKRNVLLSLPTLSNQDRELHKDMVLSAWRTGREQDPVTLTVCLGSLTCWKVKHQPCLKSFADSYRFSSKIVLYLAPSIFPLTQTSFPVPAEEKHPHSMMLPPPCFTVGMVFFRVIVFCHT